uniref:UMP-CMP kinase n=1 Tax=Strigamia maritima TaxID=126957 RepID=T1J1L5_STRMM
MKLWRWSFLYRSCTLGLSVSRRNIVRIMSGDMKPDVVFVLGGPGAGKGTQCEKISREFNFIHLSAGELLRIERNSGTPNGEVIEKHFANGTIVPVEITCGLLEKAMQQSDVKRFLIDGFPRNEDNLEGWIRLMSDKVNLLFVLFFDCPQEVCIERCLNRKRFDDTRESLKNRLTIYYGDTMPIVEYYRKLNLVKQLDATKTADEIYEIVRKTFEDALNQIKRLPRLDYFASENDIINELFEFLNLLDRNETALTNFNKDIHMRNSNTMLEKLGFCIAKQQSQIKNGGNGVFVTKGAIKKGHLAALYPGTVYKPAEPLFFQSIGNQFILQCTDGLFVDGSKKRISKHIFKSCVYRDKCSHSLPADITWLRDNPLNPLAIGQYVNNHNKKFASNVVYQECQLPKSGISQILALIPNINFSPSDENFIRIVALVATRDITTGEELFSSYISLVDCEK